MAKAKRLRSWAPGWTSALARDGVLESHGPSVCALRLALLPANQSARSFPRHLTLKLELTIDKSHNLLKIGKIFRGLDDA